MKQAQILMVEDNPGDVKLVQASLRKTKFIDNIDVATDGAEALEYLQKKGEFSAKPTPDLVLLDLNLPKQHGLDVLKEMRDNPALKNIPVMVLTSSDSPKEADQAYSLAAKLFLTKPRDVSEFDVFAECLERYWQEFMSESD